MGSDIDASICDESDGFVHSPRWWDTWHVGMRWYWSSRYGFLSTHWISAKNSENNPSSGHTEMSTEEAGLTKSQLVEVENLIEKQFSILITKIDDMRDESRRWRTESDKKLAAIERNILSFKIKGAFIAGIGSAMTAIYVFVRDFLK